MARINLLPWREEMRQEKKKEFLIQLAGMCVLAGLAGFIWIQAMDSKISAQNQRNQRLQSEIANLEKQVVEIKDLKNKRKELLDRMKVIQDLEGRRSVIVHYFDEFVNATPDGIYVTALSRKGDFLSIEGVGESNNRISSFMRKLDDSEWFSDPDLRSVVAKQVGGEQVYNFNMRIKAVVPAEEEAGAN